jgi:hypothetical protein
VALTWLLTVTSACVPPPLTSRYDSAESLARAVLTSVARNDETALRGLALTEDEFRLHVWPSLPAARAERNLPFSYVWTDLHQKSEARLRRTLALHGRQQYELKGMTFSGGVTAYPGFTIHRDSALVLRDKAGIEQRITLFGSAIEIRGAWRVFSFNAD